jgi:DNA polymerase III subunit alpha
MKITRSPRWWSAHTHSRYSAEDALGTVEDMVAKVSAMGQKALAITDHGNMAASVELYKACKKHNIAPFPGSEMYFVPDTDQHKAERKRRDGIKAQRYHLGVVAYTTEGYQNLVNLSTLSHENHFHKPLIDFRMLGQLAEDGRTQGLAVTTGCYFGYAVQQLVQHGEDAVERYFATLASWFPDSVYVEVQNHNIEHGDGWNDEKVAESLAGVALRMGLPLVTTQDAHYVEPDHRHLHESLKQLVAFGPDPDDAVFPGDGFHLADDGWISDHHSDDIHEQGLEGLADLLGKNRLSIPVLDHYSYSVPSVVPDPKEAMERRCRDAMAEKGIKSRVAWEKLDEEFDVINAADMAGYMILVAMVTDYMRENGIVFQTRGSAAGSLVCWLLGISNVDPLKWDLRFERFLSRDRTKPPDIDLDIAHDRREELIEWLNSRFTARQIGTWAKYSMNPEDGEEEGGSLLRKYFTAANKTGVTYERMDQIPAEALEDLYRLSDMKVFRGMGVNAAGIVITSNPREFNLLVPMAHRKSGGYVSQYHLKSIEDLGLVKLDVLGSKTLTVLRRCMDTLGVPLEKLEEIPLRDRSTYRTISSGETAGIFQLEGNSSKWGAKSLKADKIEDVIAAMALFRPGPQKVHSDKRYIARKHGKESIPVRHELIAKITKSTYGVMLYQEQVIDFLRALGMDPDNLTKFLKAVKASNQNVTEAREVIASYHDWIEQKCSELGMSDEDRQFMDEAIAGFADYGFNRAHATVYGLTAYRCAWLATHKSLAFHAALLAVAAGEDKETKYLRATRARGLRVMPPSINISGPTYTPDMDRGVIRKGLRSVDGVGAVMADAISSLAPFKDLDDLVERAPTAKISGGKEYDGSLSSLNGTLGKLRDAGLLEALAIKERA